MRKIIHIDMDAFYASVEQRDFPQYRGKPVIVGGSPEGRGVVATASYEARRYGVHSAMSAGKARQLCPHAIFVYPRFDVYKTVSLQIREIFMRYTDLIEPLSLDEAYLDVTTDKLQIGSAMEIAEQIRAAIFSELQLTASAGISVNKFVAKVASGMQKPNGITFIGPSRIETFMEKLPVEKFFGVGEVTARKMKSMQLHTGADLKKLSEVELIRIFGKMGSFYYRIVRGIDERPVQPFRERKSLGVEDTFPEDLTQLVQMEAELYSISQKLIERLQRSNAKGRTLTLKIKYNDFSQITRSQSFAIPFVDVSTIQATALQLLEKTDPESKPIRLLGISISNFEDTSSDSLQADKSGQLWLFS